MNKKQDTKKTSRARKIKFNTIEEALDDIREGRMVILIDDEDRITKALKAHNMQIIQRTLIEDWVGLTALKD